MGPCNLFLDVVVIGTLSLQESDTLSLGDLNIELDVEAVGVVKDEWRSWRIYLESYWPKKSIDMKYDSLLHFIHLVPPIHSMIPNRHLRKGEVSQTPSGQPYYTNPCVAHLKRRHISSFARMGWLL